MTTSIIDGKEYETFTWFERDRQHVRLEVDGVEVLCLWDEAVTEAVDDGFLKPPDWPRQSIDSNWHQPIIDCAKDMGILK